MKKEETERAVTNVNVEVPSAMLDWIDAEAAEHESSRGGVVRIALKVLMKLKQAQKERKEGEEK